MHLYEINENLYSPLHDVAYDRKKAFDKIYPALLQLFPHRFLAHSFAAQFYIDWAWEARGGGYASTVSPESWKLFGERIQLAEDEAKKGIDLDPTDPVCFNHMVTVCLAKGYPPQVMEQWFSRALLADDSDVTVCYTKMTYLLPRWYGSADDVLAFGRECVARAKENNRMPEVLITAHQTLAETAPDHDAYYAQGSCMVGPQICVRKTTCRQNATYE